MKISYNEACGRDCSDLWQDLELCERAGFDYIEIRLDMLRRFLEREPIKTVTQFFADSRLKPHAINAVYLRSGLAADKIDFADPVMADFRLACEVGKTIGSHYIIIVPPFDPGGVFHGDAAEAEADCARMLKNLAVLAKPYDMKLCFELVGMEKSCVRSVQAADRVIRAVNEDNVGFVFDCCNIYLKGRCNDFSSIRCVQKERIFAVHLMNIDHVPDEELGQDKRRFADSGDIDTDAFLQELKRAGYAGMVSAETFRPQYWQETPEWIITEAYRTTYEALKKNDCLS